MHPETRFVVKNHDFFRDLFGPMNTRGVKNINFLWMRTRGITEDEVKRFVDRGVLQSVSEPIQTVVQDLVRGPSTMVAPVPIPPEIQIRKRGRGRPPKNGSKQNKK